MSTTMDNLKKAYSAMAIKQKTFPLKELFLTTNKAAKPYQQEDGSALLPVVGVESKFVPKYLKQDENGVVTNQGFHTTLTLENGDTTGAFSGALFEFAQFFAQAVGMQFDNYFKFDFDKPIIVRVVPVPLPEGRSTYNFEPIGGEFERITSAIGSPSQYAAALTGGKDLMALEASADEPNE